MGIIVPEAEDPPDISQLDEVAKEGWDVLNMREGCDE